MNTYLVRIYSLLAFAPMLVSCQSPTGHKGTEKGWVGIWNRDIRNYGGGLEIKNVTNDSIVFSLFAANGANTGEVEGTAIINGNTARYWQLNDQDTCVLEFTRYSDSLIVIDQKKGLCYAGLGVWYSGNYYNEHYKKIKNDSDETLYSLGVLPDSLQDVQFKKLVGEDYQLFISSTQITNEDDDLDGFQAKVYESGIRGLFTLMEYIIMINGKNDIWAAVIDDNRVFYYTNRSDYRDSLPQTIRKWKERFDQYPVIYNPQLHSAVITATKAHLYKEPAEAALTKGYLVKGDKVIVLDTKEGWKKILYRSRNPDGKTIERWLKEVDLSGR